MRLGPLLVIHCLGCGGAAEPSSSRETLTVRHTTANFEILAGHAPDATLRSVATALEEFRPRVLADLGVASTGKTAVRIWQDEASFAAALESFLGQRYSATGYVTGPDEIRILAVGQVERTATHEFAHAVSMYVNPSFANNPRWLWETVALYENREFVDPRGLAYIRSGAMPTLAQLNADPNAGRQIYELGYVLGEFVVSRVGQAGLVELIRRNGDIANVMGLSASAFEAAFAEFIRVRYLS